MTGVTPGLLPELRDELLTWLEKPHMRAAYRQMAAQVGWMGQRVSPQDVDGYLRTEVDLLRAADLYFVNDDMTSLAEAAGRTLPGLTLLREDLPSERGLCVFSRPIGTYSTDDGLDDEVSIIAFSWTHGRNGGVYLCFYSWRDLNTQSALASGRYSQEDAERLRATHPRLTHDTEGAIRYGNHDHLPSGTILDGWGRTALATWLLMQQESVGASARYGFNQLDRARMKRRKVKPSPVTVIRLRYAKRADSTPTGETREYHHRWVVRGHWRRQWYPSRNGHIPIWIPAHVKGPEGAPLKTGEKVYAWVR